MSESTVAAIVVAFIGAISAIVVALIQNQKEKSEHPTNLHLVKPLPLKKQLSLSVVISFVVAASLLGFIGGLLIANSKMSSNIPPTTTFQIPTAHIIKPENGEIIETYTSFLMDYSNIPTNSYLWVVVQVPKYEYGKFYLWDNDKFQSKHNEDGAISWTIQIGDSTRSIGDVFNIVVLLVDEKVNFSFQENRKQCKTTTNQCNGIILPETGIQILDFRTVIRK